MADLRERAIQVVMQAEAPGSGPLEMVQREAEAVVDAVLEIVRDESLRAGSGVLPQSWSQDIADRDRFQAERDRLREALEEIMQRTRQESGSATAAHHIARRALLADSSKPSLSAVDSGDQVAGSITLGHLCVEAAKKDLYLEVHIWKGDQLEATVGIPDSGTADTAAECVLEVISDA